MQFLTKVSTHMAKFVKLYTFNMCRILHINYYGLILHINYYGICCLIQNPILTTC